MLLLLKRDCTVSPSMFAPDRFHPIVGSRIIQELLNWKTDHEFSSFNCRLLLTEE